MQTHLDYYSLAKEPFDRRPGRGPVLGTRALREALDWLVRHVEADHALLCVSGVPGIGRSSLARVLPGRLASGCRVARVVDPSRPWSELRIGIADQLFLQGALSRDALVGARNQGDRVVVVVDAAEQGGDELTGHLDELLGMRGPARESLVQLVLLARDPAAGDEPLWRWLEARRALVHELDRLSLEEVHGYIRKRLRVAARPGAAPPELFSEDAARVVHRHSEGVPQRVNLVCDVVLREAAERCARRVDARLVDQMMGSAGR